VESFTDGNTEGFQTVAFKRFQQFSNSPHVYTDLEKLFTLITLNCALRNGDAHLKNFGIVYDDVFGEACLAPVYDLVTTAVYLPKDSMALTLNGSTRCRQQGNFSDLAKRALAAPPRR
jgi:serine/threonine-protein kinase HipA